MTKSGTLRLVTPHCWMLRWLYGSEHRQTWVSRKPWIARLNTGYLWDFEESTEAEREGEGNNGFSCFRLWVILLLEETCFIHVNYHYQEVITIIKCFILRFPKNLTQYPEVNAGNSKLTMQEMVKASNYTAGLRIIIQATLQEK